MLCCGQKTRKNLKTDSDVKRTLKLSTQSKAEQQSKKVVVLTQNAAKTTGTNKSRRQLLISDKFHEKRTCETEDSHPVNLANGP